MGDLSKEYRKEKLIKNLFRSTEKSEQLEELRTVVDFNDSLGKRTLRGKLKILRFPRVR